MAASKRGIYYAGYELSCDGQRDVELPKHDPGVGVSGRRPHFPDRVPGAEDVDRRGVRGVQRPAVRLAIYDAGHRDAVLRIRTRKVVAETPLAPHAGGEAGHGIQRSVGCPVIVIRPRVVRPRTVAGITMEAMRVERVVRIPRRDAKLGRRKGMTLLATNHCLTPTPHVGVAPCTPENCIPLAE